MVVGNGRIVNAHVEQVIDFPSVEGIRKYVEWNNLKNRIVYYLDKNNYPSKIFDSNEHITEISESQYSIKVWLPYNNISMGN
jgi:hypothetical protein